MEKTLYGRKRKGGSHFIVVSPHTLDDFTDDTIIKNLAESLDASTVINDVYVKPNGHLAKKNPERLADFNRLPWGSYGENSIHDITCDGLKHFVSDLFEYTRFISIQLNKIPVIVHLHGMKDRDNHIAIDMGIWVRIRNDLTTSKDYAQTFLSHDNIIEGWSVIADVRKALRVKAYWNLRLKNERDYTAGIGEIFFAGDPKRLAQVHRHLGYHANSLQLEINCSIQNDTEYIVSLLSEGLKLHY